MIDVHNFRFQSSDGGVSTSTTGSRSSAPSCPRPMTREYEFLFLRFFFYFYFFSPCPTLLALLSLFSPAGCPFCTSSHPSLALLSSCSPLILHLSLCTFPTDHYFLFVTLYDELVQVRCSRREAFTGSPFFAPSSFPLSHAFPPFVGSPRLLALPSYLSFVSRPSCSRSATLPPRRDVVLRAGE